jgi:spore germination protein KB
MALGVPYAKTVAYPTYLVLSVVRIGKFLNRLEVLAASVFCIAVFMKISIVLLATCKGITYLCKIKNYHTLVFPVALMIVNFTLTSFNSVVQFQDWVFKAWPYYMSVFSLIIPLVIFIMVEFRYRFLRKKGKLEFIINKT